MFHGHPFGEKLHILTKSIYNTDYKSTIAPAPPPHLYLVDEANRHIVLEDGDYIGLIL